LTQEFIAEVGVNHEGSLKNAKLMIDQLSEIGCKIVKFQTYKSELIAAKTAKAYWDLTKESATNQRELFAKYDHFTKHDYIHLAEYAKAKNMEFMTTFFDIRTMPELIDYVDRVKIASADLTNYELLEALSAKGKPIILSTGAATLEEVSEAVEYLLSQSVSDISLLHCVLRYPTDPKYAALSRISELKNRFPTLTIGYSDHTAPNNNFLVQIAAYLLGARLLEKHFTFDKSLKGNDHYHSFDKDDLSEYFSRIAQIDEVLDFEEITFIQNQVDARTQARRGLYYFSELECGSTISAKDVIALRPVAEIPASSYFSIIGKKLKVNIQEGDAIRLSDFE
jgi:sialic acid synthase SpsE